MARVGDEDVLGLQTLWGVFIWREFKDAPEGTDRLLALMFVSYFVGLGLLVYAGT